MKRSRILPWIIHILFIVLVAWLAARFVAAHRTLSRIEELAGALDSREDDRALLEGVLFRVRASHVESHEGRELIRSAVNGVLAGIDDPHAKLLVPEDYEALSVDTEGSYGGIGVGLASTGTGYLVRTIVPSGPAARAGVLPGDRVTRVDGQSVEGWGLDEVARRVRGPRGEIVSVEVERLGSDSSLIFNIERATVDAVTVTSAYLGGDSIAYIELSGFSDRSASELERHLHRFSSEGAHGLILDLRNNPGGVLEAAESVAEMFLEPGDTISVLSGRDGAVREALVADRASPYADVPLVLIVGPNSASASEIVAGALQDHDRALVVGENTYGKGSVQTLYPVAGGHWVKLTTGRWLTPSGRSIQRTTSGNEGGIAPDSVVPGTSYPGGEELYDHFGTRWDAFRGEFQRYALEMARSGRSIPRDASSGDVMSEVGRLRGVLHDKGLAIPDSLFASTRNWLAVELLAEALTLRNGESDAKRFLNQYDPAVQVARTLLKSGGSPDAPLHLSVKATH